MRQINYVSTIIYKRKKYCLQNISDPKDYIYISFKKKSFKIYPTWVEIGLFYIASFAGGNFFVNVILEFEHFYECFGGRVMIASDIF